MNPAWSIAPVIDWLMHKGRHLAAPEALVGELCARVRVAGELLRAPGEDAERAYSRASPARRQRAMFAVAAAAGAVTCARALAEPRAAALVLRPALRIVRGLIASV